MLHKIFKPTFITLALLIAAACNSNESAEVNSNDTFNKHRANISAELEPMSIEYRQDTCDYDGKEIRTKRFGAELETEDGTRHKFCSAEHMIAFMMEDDSITDENSKARVVEFIDGGQLIDPTQTTVLKTPNQPSPGGMNFLPMATGQDHAIQRMQDLYTGELLTWDEAREQVAKEWDLN